ncbi:MAG: hypothetical protein KDA47_20870, partial [Planctomycetales bacterium]|nr:hypothetical protein [Planctomycetales bacterium]
MIIASCPECNEHVLVPDGVDARAIVRCQYCDETFELAKLLGGLPKPLEIIEQPEEADALADDMLEPSYQDHLFGGAMIGSAGGDSEAAVAVLEEPVVADDSFSFGGESTAASPASPAFKASPRPKKKGKNPIVEVVKIAGGGIVGIVLAILIMWWGLGKDPFALGPKVAAYASFLVPSQFHGTGASTANGNGPIVAGNAGAGTGGVFGTGGTAPSGNGANGNSANGGEQLDSLPPFGPPGGEMASVDPFAGGLNPTIETPNPE